MPWNWLSRLSLILAVGWIGLSCAAASQQASRMYRVGYIQTATEAEQAHLTKAFEDALRELGYAEGRNVILEKRFADGKPERLPALAAELARLKVDVIVTGGNPVIAAVKQATTTIPVVMTTGRDPVAAGFIASYARPGGNITGLATDPGPAILGKNLEFFKQAVPGARRVALLWNPAPPSADAYREAAEDAARKMAVTLQVVPVRARDELEGAFAAMAHGRAEGLWVLPDPLTFTARRQVVDLAARHRIPAVYWQREFVDLGGLISYGSNVSQQFRRAASYVDRILKGAAPGELPVEQAASFELVVNLKNARALGIAIPQTLLLQADTVIQ
jgi:putative ABC transport system substrate-binding protein